MNKFTAIDLFAGGGGLTVGLKAAGFDVVGAVELDPVAYSCYKSNHPEVLAFKQDITTLSPSSFRSKLNGRPLSLLVGCPPCQGFSSLTQKYRRKDPRNELVREMFRFAEALQPKMVMMENVPGLTHRGKKLLEVLIVQLRSIGYQVTYDVLQVADYGVPQFRKRLVLLAGLGFSPKIPKATHSEDGDGGLRTWLNVRSAIGGLKRPVSFSFAMKNGGPERFDWHVIRDMDPITIERLRHVRAGSSRSKIPSHLRPPCHRRRKDGFSNVYGRMTWKDPSPTITSGCVTLSKGRFGHPTQLRTISVREAALLQTFPRDYIFDSNQIEKVVPIIGNALPCEFARKLAIGCKRQIRAISAAETF